MKKLMRPLRRWWFAWRAAASWKRGRRVYRWSYDEGRYAWLFRRELALIAKSIDPDLLVYFDSRFNCAEFRKQKWGVIARVRVYGDSYEDNPPREAIVYSALSLPATIKDKFSDGLPTLKVKFIPEIISTLNSGREIVWLRGR